jgi:hypothetical protein
LIGASIGASIGRRRRPVVWSVLALVPAWEPLLLALVPLGHGCRPEMRMRDLPDEWEGVDVREDVGDHWAELYDDDEDRSDDRKEEAADA